MDKGEAFDIHMRLELAEDTLRNCLSVIEKMNKQADTILKICKALNDCNTQLARRIERLEK